MEKKIRKGRVFAVVLILALVFIYAVYLVAKLVQNPTNTFMVTNGKISQEESDIGYIIREETVVKGQNYKNGMVKIKNEGEKVAKGDSVFRYYSSGEEELKNKIAELDVEIQSLMQNEKSSFPSDVKLLESQIEKELDSIYGVNNVQKIQEYKKNINSYITRKAKISSPSNSHLKELLSQREEYENRLTSDSENVDAPESGIVSYRVDGLEEKLTPENLGEITDTFLEGLDLKTGQIISSSSDCGKIIDNFKYYIAITTNSELGNNAKVGDSVTLRLSGTEEEKADIVQINEGSGKKTIIFEVDRMSTTVINHRKIAVDIIWWEKAGFKVPNQAIYSETINNNEINYVIKNKSGIESKSYVKIQKQNENFSIISSYETKELQELGVSEEDIKNYKKIVNYDEIVLKKQK